jgi:hypothetical protein
MSPSYAVSDWFAVTPTTLQTRCGERMSDATKDHQSPPNDPNELEIRVKLDELGQVRPVGAPAAYKVHGAR